MNITRRLKQIVLFENCTQDELNQVSNSAIHKRYNQGELIIKEGLFADAFYIILEGSVEVFTREPEGKIVMLARLEEDDYFGEQAYLNNLTRTVSVKALTDIELLEINYAWLDPIFKRCSKLKNIFKKAALGRSLSNLQLQLRSMDSYVKKEIFTRSEKTFIKHCKKGDLIFKSGDVSDFAYFISSGSVSLSFGNITPKVIHKNHVFGELGILHGTPRSATAKAMTNTSVITISKEDFMSAVKHSIGFRSLMMALSKLYALPLNKTPIEQFISKLDGEEAILIKYKLPDGKFATYTKVISQPTVKFAVEKIESDITLKFMHGRSLQRTIKLKDNMIVGITVHGEWEELNILCEMLLDEIKITHHISPEEFASTGNLLATSKL